VTELAQPCPSVTVPKYHAKLTKVKVVFKPSSCFSTNPPSIILLNLPVVFAEEPGQVIFLGERDLLFPVA